MTNTQRRVCAFVQAHPRLLAALYDLGLTPLSQMTPDHDRVAATMMRARVYRSPAAAAADEARASERASCAAIATQVEHEALGSPIAQDTARRIRDAILALR